VRALPPHDANTVPGRYEAPSSAFPATPKGGDTSTRLTIPGLGTVLIGSAGFAVPGLPGVSVPVPGLPGGDRSLPTREVEPVPGPPKATPPGRPPGPPTPPSSPPTPN